MKKADLYKYFIEYFQATMPEAKTELHYENAFQLLVAVMLSAQCTDKRVNMVTPALFEAYPSPQSMASASVDELLHFVKSVSYPNNKATHLQKMAVILVEKHGGEVPSDFDELVALPGVGRKTANVMLSVFFNQSKMPVDTHVFRLSHRIGLVPKRCTTPYAVEKELVKNFPEELVSLAHHWLILHGRYVCKALKPMCGECGLQSICKHFKSLSAR